MNALFYKAWLECRLRLILCVSLSALLLLNAIVVMPFKLEGLPPAQASEKIALYWTIVLSLYLGLMAPMFAILLAGSGINSQTNWGMLHGFHSSMYYALSMPATRGQMLAARAGMGALLLAPVLVVTHVGLALGTAWRGLHGPAALAIEQAPQVLVLGLTFYSFEIFLASVFDEMWSSMIGLAIAGGILGYNLAGGIDRGNIFVYVRGTETWTGAATLAMAGLCIIWLALAFRAVRRREY